MQSHKDRGSNEREERSDERLNPPTDQPGDPRREKPDNCLLDAGDLVLPCQELNDKTR